MLAALTTASTGSVVMSAARAVIAGCMGAIFAFAAGGRDGSYESMHYADPSFVSQNAPLIVKQPGSTVHDPVNQVISSEELRALVSCISTSRARLRPS